jgi:NAD(P)-dependent dehydrogenase (short-subunit alcohol dehydrogenase family)
MNTQDLFSLKNRVAVVTGGSRGIGRMIAQGLLCQGARVYITARKVAACDAAAQALSAWGTCVSLPVDISTAEGVQQLVQRFAQHEDQLDILVNNAGAAWAAPFDDFPESGWDKVVNLNMKTPFFLTQAFAPMLRKAAQHHMAKVIHIASVDGISVNPLETYSYAASKSGLIHLTRRMSQTLIAEGICVNAIAPGAFVSDMNRDARDNGEAVAQRIPAQRIGRDEDMAAAAIYLASAASDYVVGHTLVVDGGVTHARGYATLP